MSSPFDKLMYINALKGAQASGRTGPLAMLALQHGFARGGSQPLRQPTAAGLTTPDDGLSTQGIPGSQNLVRGPGGGQDDNVPAALSPGEYVWDADTVSAIGDGSNEEGARRLDELRQRIRAQKRSAPATKIPPKAKKPEQYMRGIK